MYARNKYITILAIQIIIMLQLCGCQTNKPEHAGAHWGYSGSTGPAHWGELSDDFILAKTGKQQSPVDIVGSKAAKGQFQIRYNSTALSLVNNGHAIEQEYEEGSILEADNKAYELKQFHIHSPSEHTVAGRRFDMEIHLVHKSTSGEIAVAAVLFQEGKENSFLAQFWNRLPEKSGGTIQDQNLSINIEKILPENKSCFAYKGSLTTPPCSEGVRWYVFSNPVELSTSQLAAFQTLYKGNFRPVQPLNGRTIHLYQE